MNQDRNLGAGKMFVNVPVLSAAMAITALLFMIAPFLILQTKRAPRSVPSLNAVSVRPASLPSSRSQPATTGATPQAPSSPEQAPVAPDIPRPTPRPPVPVPVLSASNPLDSLRTALKPQLSVGTGVTSPAAAFPPSGLEFPGGGTASGAEAVDAMPEILGRAPLVYPEKARQQGIQGTVSVRFTVGVNGRADDVDIVRSDPPGVFDESVRRALGGYRFKPATRAGDPVPVQVETTVNFQLDGS